MPPKPAGEADREQGSPQTRQPADQLSSWMSTCSHLSDGPCYRDAESESRIWILGLIAHWENKLHCVPGIRKN